MPSDTPVDIQVLSRSDQPERHECTPLTVRVLCCIEHPSTSPPSPEFSGLRGRQLSLLPPIKTHSLSGRENGCGPLSHRQSTDALLFDNS